MRRACLDPNARARVVERRPLGYDDARARQVGAPWVRSGSGLARFGKRLVMVQDDALWLACLDEHGALTAQALPADASGQRLFLDKRQKPDFEAAVVLGERLLVLGSGSLPSRERIAIVTADGATRLIDATRLYGLLRQEKRFAGSQLNVEGAVLQGDRLLLACRGNAAAMNSAGFDATVELEPSALLRYLDDPLRAALPALGKIEQYWLGEVGGVRLTLTDMAARNGQTYYVAAAEASPDAIADGPVGGVSIGVLGEAPRYALIESESGATLCDKVEGLAPGDHLSDWWAVVDADDISKPAELLRVRCEGL